MSEPNPEATTEAHTALTHALQHLRHAMRLTTSTDRLIVAGGPEAPETQRCAALYADIAAAARSCANLIDHLDGFRAPGVGERRQAVFDAAKRRHPAGTGL
ncbi:hypothetical protein MYCODSM44623_04363 [Mycobacterium intracellulare subsp. chimaera]|uniref:hypothetical protein n=1 Tax=Mycobacterium intracellulare TaxID=1767 RepID=UPI00093FE913|nr:hypothetical protein [Mycobacterium intracellulare]ASL11055.1 hypothetical protein MYCODSM44623_04363 [Mycobacterium intracellulare subsp. chimaera]MCV7324539.1 hypothetical protein [Mycobacterium intracellulare subsp. chimaera]ORV33101.1 hypothetical protein AWB97_10060 [Mycobacterium intracellulare subsp. chimaera]